MARNIARLVRRHLFGGHLNFAWRAGRNRRQHVLLPLHQRGGVVAGQLEAVAMRNCVGGAGFDAVAAEDAAVVVDVIHGRVALAARDAHRFGVLGGLGIDAVGRTGGGAQEARHALFEPVGVALQDVRAAKTLFEFRRLVGIILRHRRRHHLFERDAHSLGDRGSGTEDVEFRGHVSLLILTLTPPGSLIPRASTRLPFRNVFSLTDRGHTGQPAQPFDLLPLPALDHARNRSIALDQEQRRHARNAVGVAGGELVLLAVEEHRKAHSEVARESPRVLRAILRDAINRQRRGVVQPFQKWKSELADGAGYLEKREQNRPVGEQLGQRRFAAIEPRQPEIGCARAFGYEPVLPGSGHTSSVANPAAAATEAAPPCRANPHPRGSAPFRAPSALWIAFAIETVSARGYSVRASASACRRTSRRPFTRKS